MSRPKKDNHPIAVRLATPIYDRLAEFCKESGQPKTLAIERALVMYLDDYYDKKEKLAQLDK